jgi:TP901-1 family phage major tail protein
MAIRNGRLVKLQINTGTEQSPTWAAVGKQSEGTFSLNVSDADTSHKDDDGFESHIPVTVGGSVSAGGRADVTDAALEALEDDILALAQRQFRWHEGTGGRTWTGLGTVTSLEYDAPNNDVMGYSIEIKLSGAITRADVA